MAGNCDQRLLLRVFVDDGVASATQPLPKEVNPKIVFERLFVHQTAGDGRRRTQTRRRACSTSSARTPTDLNAKLGTNDQRKLDEYFSSVRDIEQRIERAEKLAPVKTARLQGAHGGARQYEEHVRLHVRPAGRLPSRPT